MASVIINHNRSPKIRGMEGWAPLGVVKQGK